MNTKIYSFAKKLGLILKKKKLFVVTAESCTGGLLATSITDVPGSSAYFERGFVVYSNAAKKESLGVSSQTIKKIGAVSEMVAMEMAEGALKNSHAQIGIAITGIAGPTGGSKSKPKGMVCFALAYKEVPPKAVTTYFKGSRREVREQAVLFALRWLLLEL
jgi:nicotinamide-nucleotide amidase